VTFFETQCKLACLPLGNYVQLFNSIRYKKYTLYNVDFIWRLEKLCQTVDSFLHTQKSWTEKSHQRDQLNQKYNKQNQSL